MKEIPLPPYAPTLLNSMRAVGYSFEAALADIIDNSISAKAKNIRVRFDPYDKPYVAIIDDGVGMDKDELQKAMRHGSQDPNMPRDAGDMGRFGLGLKTASLSQCRKLTVVSKKNGQISACMWDLDLVKRRENWILAVLDKSEAEKLWFVDQLGRNGTIVIWEEFDRLHAGEASLEKTLTDAIDMARHHLAMVFHRYLSGEQLIKKIAISINEGPIEPFDPYMLWHKATQLLPTEIIQIDADEVVVRPFILPHQSKLKAAEIERAGGKEGLRRDQGFYVYRNKRLISWGTWFRLARQEELTKLARVQVDIPNSLDHLWELDIKKSVAYPPEIVRQNLKRIIERIAESSRRVFIFRGRSSNTGNIVCSWDRITDRQGISYRINHEHPLFSKLMVQLNEQKKRLLVALISAIETNLPIDAIYADMGADHRNVQQKAQTEDNILELARALISTTVNREEAEKLLSNLQLVEPFCHYPDLIVKLPALLEE